MGASADPRGRFRQHQRDKAWWPEVAAREVEWFGSREEALKQEARAIVRELPRHNDMGVQWPHHRLGAAPARTLHTTDFKADPQGWMDRVAETQRPIVVTRYKVPQVVIVPYFDRSQVPAEESAD
ncbi:type II toxin-antitoxin system prevent-host-death family antitoxin [Streptomyces griseoincarnatus]